MEIWKVTNAEWYEMVEDPTVFHSKQEGIDYIKKEWSGFLAGEDIDSLIGDLISIEQLHYWEPDKE